MTPLNLAQAAASGTTLATLSDVASIVIAVGLLVLVLVALSVFLRLNRLLGDMKGLAQENIGPVSDRAKLISDNLEFITQALRTDVERLNSSVRALSDRLHQASEHMEDRIEDFNALMEVVQGEAEEIFLDTASTVRGVKAGARQIASPHLHNNPGAPNLDEDDRDEESAQSPQDEFVQSDSDPPEDQPTEPVGSPVDNGA
ncbi:MAG: hypothetical protein L7S64_02485 [Longimicrobiales bacterium]|nr:hypothetical protein [Longimicrobiales bacterium]